jgi:ribosomal protein L39E
MCLMSWPNAVSFDCRNREYQAPARRSWRTQVSYGRSTFLRVVLNARNTLADPKLGRFVSPQKAQPRMAPMQLLSNAKTARKTLMRLAAMVQRRLPKWVMLCRCNGGMSITERTLAPAETSAGGVAQ